MIGHSRILLLLSVLGGVFSCAAQEDLLVRQIQDTDVPRLLVVLKAEAAGLRRLAAPAAAPQFSVQDPLHWLQRNFPYTAVPSGAVYNVECSRFASAQEFTPVAVFSYGGKASEFADAALNAREFYRSRKFRDSDVARRLLVFRYVSPDSSMTAEFYQANVFLPDGCRSMATGPMIRLSAAQPPSAENAPAPPFDLAAVLRKSGMRETEYESLRIALLMARSDAQDTSVLQLAAADAPPAAKSQIAIRQKNAETYRKYATEFSPILDSLLAIN